MDNNSSQNYSISKKLTEDKLISEASEFILYKIGKLHFHWTKYMNTMNVKYFLSFILGNIVHNKLSLLSHNLQNVLSILHFYIM